MLDISKALVQILQILTHVKVKHSRVAITAKRSINCQKNSANVAINTSKIN